jgi:uncharacterized protein YwgA
MTVKSAMDLMVLLLYAKNNEKIVGTTRLTKLIFLLIGEGGFKQFQNDYDFEPYKYGPWSAEIINFSETLNEIGALSIEKEELEDYDEDILTIADGQRETFTEEEKNKKSIFNLTDDGIKIAKVLKARASEREIQSIEEIKMRFNPITMHDLLEYVYSQYPEYTWKSKIKNRVINPKNEFKKYFPESRVDEKLFSFVGTQPQMTLKEEKRAIKDTIWKRLEA